MTAQQDGSAWVRLGELLEERRVEIDPSYRNLRLFCEEAGLDYRLCWDIEHARRTNYRRPTLTAVEVAYGWKPGSIRSVLAGGDPTPSAISPERREALRAARKGLAARASDERRNGTSGLPTRRHQIR